MNWFGKKNIMISLMTLITLFCLVRVYGLPNAPSRERAGKEEGITEGRGQTAKNGRVLAEAGGQKGCEKGEEED